MKKVSVIIPYYNGENYIATALESLKKQTYSNFEVILVNNNSSDNSEDICKKAAENDSRFKCVNESTQGIASALNTGIKNAAGEIIAFLDQDDIYLEDRISETVNLLENEKVDCIACRGYKVDETLKIFGETNEYNISRELIPFYLLQDNLVTSLSYFTIRKSMLEKYLPLPSKYSNMLDYFLMMNFIKNNEKTVFCNKLLVKRRYHNTNISLNIAAKAHQIIPLLIEYYQSYEVINRIVSKEGFQKVITKRYIDSVQSLRRQNRFNEMIDFMTEYVKSNYILKEFYLYFAGIAMLRINKEHVRDFIEDNKIQHPLYYFIKGLYCYEKKFFEESAKCFTKAYKKSGRRFLEALNSKALAEYFIDKKKSFKIIKKVINIDPFYNDSLLNLGFMKKNNEKLFKHSIMSPKTITYFLI
ncbi:MAG: glycosyl transferase family 2 [uncultured bacterium]|nr:MAG: glycosyl transferase family 2 [uncultured bacterium]